VTPRESDFQRRPQRDLQAGGVLAGVAAAVAMQIAAVGPLYPWIYGLGFKVLCPWLLVSLGLPIALCVLGGSSYAITLPANLALSLTLCSFVLRIHWRSGLYAGHSFDDPATRDHLRVLLLGTAVSITVAIIITFAWRGITRRGTPRTHAG
jgi:hypothetical protein